MAGAVIERRSLGKWVEAEHIAAAVTWNLLALLLALPLILLARRMSGAFAQPLGGTGLVMAVLGIGLINAAVRWSCCLCGRGSALGFSHASAVAVLFALPGVASLLLLATITVPGTDALHILAASFLLVGSEVASWVVFLRRAERRGPEGEGASSLTDAVDVEIPPGLVQQITRVCEEGRESIHAIVVAEIPAQGRVGVGHIAFCPPLGAQPELTAHALNADELEVRITQAETFGARLEVRAPHATPERRTVRVELLGSVIAGQSA